MTCNTGYTSDGTVFVRHEFDHSNSRKAATTEIVQTSTGTDGNVPNRRNSTL